METRRYFGCMIRQRESNETVPFFLFHARIKDMKRWAGIRRIEDQPTGTQRVLRETRARAITRFLESDPRNTIPNSLLLAFEPNTVTYSRAGQQLEPCIPLEDLGNGCENQTEWGFIEFEFDPSKPEHERPALIVDGQHRLYGMAGFGDEDLTAIVIGLVGASHQEQAFQFIVVNSKSVKVPTDNVKSIIAEFDEVELQARLLKGGVKYGDVSPVLRDVDDLEISPFRNLLDWAHNRDGTKLVPLTAVEQSLRYLRDLFAFLADDEDTLLQLFLAMWRGVRAQYPDLWGRDNKLMKKVCLNALNEFLADRLKFAWELGLVQIFNPDEVERMTLNMLQVPSQFWETDWDIRIQDNANVRELIKTDLGKISDNLRLRENWASGIELISSNSAA